jgi:hypothetical protein
LEENIHSPQNPIQSFPLCGYRAVRVRSKNVPSARHPQRQTFVLSLRFKLQQRNNAIAIETEGYTPDLEERRKVVAAEIAGTKERIAQVGTPSQTVSPAAAAKAIRKRLSASKGLRIEDRKRLLAETVESIVVQSDDGEEIAIRFKFKVGIK